MKTDATNAITLSHPKVEGDYIFGFDPAYGDDYAVRSKVKRIGDGTFELVELQKWDKQREEWVLA